MKLNKRETATVLAALRYWQKRKDFSGTEELDIATAGGTVVRLLPKEIDALCERINCDSDQEEPCRAHGDFACTECGNECPECFGNGSVWTSACEERCLACNGTGRKS